MDFCRHGRRVGLLISSSARLFLARWLSLSRTPRHSTFGPLGRLPFPLVFPLLRAFLVLPTVFHPTPRSASKSSLILFRVHLLSPLALSDSVSPSLAFLRSLPHATRCQLRRPRLPGFLYHISHFPSLFAFSHPSLSDLPPPGLFVFFVSSIDYCPAPMAYLIDSFLASPSCPHHIHCLCP